MPPNAQCFPETRCPTSQPRRWRAGEVGTGRSARAGEAVPLPTRLQFEKPNPTPNSDDVDFYDKWTTGPDDLDVDAIVKRWRSQER